MEENRIKLLVSDIDDTLVHKETELDQETVSMIERLRERGIGFTLATGRMPYRAENFARQAGLTLPFIANNGSILCRDGQFCYRKMLYAGQFQDIFRRYMKEDLDFTVIFSYPDRERPILETEWVKARRHKYKGYDEPLGDLDAVWEQEVDKVYILDEKRSGIIGRAVEELRQKKCACSIFQYQQYSAEIVAEGCSKASGLRQLLKELGLKQSEVLAVGDHSNDIEMLLEAGIGAAVGNAQPELKAVADYTAQAERAAGVREIVRHFLSV